MARERKRGIEDEVLYDADGYIEQQLPADLIVVPPFIELADGRLVYAGYRLNERWRRRILARTQGKLDKDNARELFKDLVEEVRPARPRRGMLLRFCKLADAEDARILAFARLWGPLYLCKHGLPFTHDPPLVPFSWSKTLSDPAPSRECRPLGWGGWSGWEPLDGWRRLARAVSAVLRIGAALAQARPAGAEEWKTAWSFSRDPNKAPHTRVADQRRDLGSLSDSWLMMGRVRPSMGCAREGYEIRVAGLGLFGTIAIQVMFYVAQARGWAVCTRCNRVFPPDRQPSLGRRTYCSRCRDRNAPVRDAERAYRDRKRRGIALLRNGLGPTEVAQETRSRLATVEGWKRNLEGQKPGRTPNPTAKHRARPKQARP
jgi:hypothetical protein